MALLTFENVCKRYPSGQDALLDVNFQMDAGEMVFLTGHSGAGKSTVLRLVHLAERASRGSVVLEGRNLAQVRAHGVPAVRRRLGMVFQDHRLLLDRSVFENLATRAEIGRRVRAALDRVGLLAREGALPTALSAGEQQRVGIARAIVVQPVLLLADEPTGNLDPQLAADIMGLFASVSAQGTTVLVASHDLHLVRKMSKRVLVLDHGRLIDDFRPGVA